MILNRIQNFIKMKISAENIIKKNIKLDQLAILALNENQLKDYNCTSKSIYNFKHQKENEKQNEIKVLNANDSKNLNATFSNTNSNLNIFPVK